MDWAALTDEELIGAYRAGLGEESLSELFRRFRPRVTNWCIRFTQDREASPDLAQDILFRAYRSLHTYRGDSRFSTWLYVITRNQCSILAAVARQVAKSSASPGARAACAALIRSSRSSNARAWYIGLRSN